MPIGTSPIGDAVVGGESESPTSSPSSEQRLCTEFTCCDPELFSFRSGQVVVVVVDTEAPSVPANVSASSTGPTSVVLTWDESSDDTGVTGYTIERDGVVIYP